MGVKLFPINKQIFAFLFNPEMVILETMKNLHCRWRFFAFFYFRLL